MVLLSIGGIISIITVFIMAAGGRGDAKRVNQAALAAAALTFIFAVVGCITASIGVYSNNAQTYQSLQIFIPGLPLSVSGAVSAFFLFLSGATGGCAPAPPPSPPKPAPQVHMPYSRNTAV